MKLGPFLGENTESGEDPFFKLFVVFNVDFEDLENLPETSHN